VLTVTQPHFWIVVLAAIGALITFMTGHLTGSQWVGIETGLGAIEAVIQAVLDARGQSGLHRAIQLKIGKYR